MALDMHTVFLSAWMVLLFIGGYRALDMLSWGVRTPMREGENAMLFGIVLGIVIAFLFLTTFWLVV